MKTVVTGTGRSGTTLIHRVLTLAGADVGVHELYCGRDGAVGGFRVLANFKKPYQLITQVRDPIGTINSVLATTPSDFPVLGLYKENFDTLELYTLTVWNRMHKYLIENSVMVYTLENLNKGEVTKELIELYNLEITPEQFDKLVQTVLQTGARNTRSRSINITEESLISQDKLLYYDSVELYNKINNAYSKT